MFHTDKNRTPQQVRGLAVYIHWPFCKSKCPYCDFNSHVRDSVDQERWKSALLTELDTMAAQVPDRNVTSIFFGGGTPSLMPPATAGALIERVHTLWKTSDDIEITLEANPTSVEIGTFPAFKSAGINRVSLGVQSLDNKELAFLGREHSANEALKAIDLARSTFDRYSFDLIYARPHQTLASWEKELAQALPLTGEHLSLYQLTIEENTAFHHAYAKGGFTLPDEETSEALYRLTEEMTSAHGIPAYEVSNYARAGQESRHNMSYWKGDDYIGVGPGAHGRVTINAPTIAPTGAHMAQRSGLARPTDRAPLRIATQTIKSPERWLSAVEEKGQALEVWQEVDKQTEMEERLMMGLRLREGIGYEDFEKRTGVKLDSVVDEKKRALYIDKGLLENIQGRLQPTLKGRLVLNALTASLVS